MTMRTRGIAAVGASLTGLGAAITAAAASLCCIGPAVVSIAGVGGALAAARLQPYRPILIVASLLLIGMGIWFAYRPAAASDLGAACPSRAGRISRIVVWVAATLWLVALVAPHVIGILAGR